MWWEYTSLSNWRQGQHRLSVHTSPTSTRHLHLKRPAFDSHLRGPFNLVPCFDGLWTPIFCQLNWDPLTEFTHPKPAVGQKHARLSGNKHLEVNGTLLCYKSLKLSGILLQGSLVTLSLNATVWKWLGSRQKPGRGGGQKLKHLEASFCHWRPTPK